LTEKKIQNGGEKNFKLENQHKKIKFKLRDYKYEYDRYVESKLKLVVGITCRFKQVIQRGRILTL